MSTPRVAKRYRWLVASTDTVVFEVEDSDGWVDMLVLPAVLLDESRRERMNKFLVERGFEVDDGSSGALYGIENGLSWLKQQNTSAPLSPQDIAKALKRAYSK